MPVIEVDSLTRVYGPVRAIDSLSFDVSEGEILVIVGASGCGKTTTLRCIAGLDVPTSGTVKIDERLVAGNGTFIPPERRGIGMVFQSYALWPNKTVFENVAYSLLVQGMPKAQIREKVAEAMTLVGLAGKEDRYPATLSGGQQQRVAFARCAVAQPRVLLLDEPLSNLDAKLREQMRDELKNLIKSLKSTAIHITHDQTEAMAIADRIICMRDGRMEQIGSARDLYRMPASPFVADFIGAAAFLNGTVKDHDATGKVRVAIGQGIDLWAVPAPNGSSDGAVTLCLRPEDVSISVVPRQGPNVLFGTVTKETFLGDHIEYVIECAGLKIKARSQDDFAVGSSIYAAIDPNKLVSLARD
jgi:iron(III) transport system ATP-binding protein